MLALLTCSLAALYAICIFYVVVNDASAYADPVRLDPWRWQWRFLLAPWVMLSEAWDKRYSAWRGMTRRP